MLNTTHTLNKMSESTRKDIGEYKPGLQSGSWGPYGLTYRRRLMQAAVTTYIPMYCLGTFCHLFCEDNIV